MTAHYDHVVVDMPRRVDPYMVPVLEKADRIVLVVEQTLSHIRDATRMLQIFGAYGITANQVLVVVNRFDKSSAIRVDDVARALQGTEMMSVPSDFKTVSESINLGVPMHEHARSSAVTRALIGLEARLGGKSRDSGTGLFGTLTSILRKEAWQRT
jgi:pilus assembly protein CpaE